MEIGLIRNIFLYLLCIINIEVTVTAYTPTVGETDDTPYITASNTRVRNGIVAISRDIEKKYNLKFGDKIHLEGIGTFEYQDRMHSRWKKRVDIFMYSNKKARQFGKRQTILKIRRR